MKTKFLTSTLLALVLTACGGGSDNDDPPATTGPSNVSKPVATTAAQVSTDGIRWFNNANDQIVMDANEQQFKVLAQTGCVYSVAERFQIVNWCIAHPSEASRMFWVNRYVSVRGHRAPDGRCVAYFVDEATAKVVDVAVVNGQFAYAEVDLFIIPC